jgi:hypothetical protein
VESREGQGHGDTGLQDEIGAEKQKKYQQKHDVQQWNYDQPGEVIFLRPGKLHASLS